MFGYHSMAVGDEFFYGAEWPTGAFHWKVIEIYPDGNAKLQNMKDKREHIGHTSNMFSNTWWTKIPAKGKKKRKVI